MNEVQEYVRDNAALRAAVGAGVGEVIELHPFGTGEHNVNYWFEAAGEKFVLRVNVASQPFHENQVAYEFAALQALEASGCTPTPVYLDDSPAALGKGVIVEGFCEGRELDFDNLQPGDLDCAVALMADVHAVPISEDCPLYRPKDPLRELFEECIARFEVYRASAFEEPRITRWVERFIARAEEALETPCRPEDCAHIVNTEPLPSHFLIAADSGAFVDWERPIIGEVAQDLAYFTAPTTTFWDSDYLMSADEAERLIEEYWRAVDGRFERGSFDERLRAWHAMTALRSITWCCRALVHYSQPGAHKTQRTIEKLPVYLSDEFMEAVSGSKGVTL